MTKERLRKPDPDRAEPIRDWEQLFRHSEQHRAESNGIGTDKSGVNGNNGHGNNGHSNNGQGWDDAVTHAVKLGYQIIEDQISQGKRVAEQLSDNTRASQSVGGDVSDFVRRLLQFYTDIGATCFDFIDSLTHSKEFNDNVRGWVDEGLAGTSGNDAPAPAQSQANSGEHHNIPVEVQCEHSARVSLQLTEEANGSRLGVPGLFGIDPSNGALQDIEFIYEPGQHRPTLIVRIGKDQAADTYTGAVVDTVTNEPRGTLSVQIRHEVNTAS
jgi:hypothetical protein